MKLRRQQGLRSERGLGSHRCPAVLRVRACTPHTRGWERTETRYTRDTRRGGAGLQVDKIRLWAVTPFILFPSASPTMTTRHTAKQCQVKHFNFQAFHQKVTTNYSSARAHGFFQSPHAQGPTCMAQGGKPLVSWAPAQPVCRMSPYNPRSRHLPQQPRGYEASACTRAVFRATRKVPTHLALRGGHRSCRLWTLPESSKRPSSGEQG